MRTDGRTDMTKQIVTSRNFANAPKSFKLKLNRTLCVAEGLISLPASDKPHYVISCNNKLHDHLKDIQQNKRSYTETFWKTNEQRNKIKNPQHYS